MDRAACDLRCTILGRLEIDAVDLPGSQVERDQAFEHIVHRRAWEAQPQRRAANRAAPLEIADTVLVEDHATDWEFGHSSLLQDLRMGCGEGATLPTNISTSARGG